MAGNNRVAYNRLQRGSSELYDAALVYVGSALLPLLPCVGAIQAAMPRRGSLSGASVGDRATQCRRTIASLCEVFTLIG